MRAAARAAPTTVKERLAVIATSAPSVILQSKMPPPPQAVEALNGKRKNASEKRKRLIFLSACEANLAIERSEII